MEPIGQMNGYPFELDDFDPEKDSITSEIIEPAINDADRSIARRASLQILYELDTTKHPVPTVLEAHIYERPESYEVRQIIRRIVAGVVAHRDSIDSLIQKYAPEWPIDQVATIDRNILRIAVYEYLLQKRITPIAVIINEAIHLAEVFGAQNSHSFVHGVLGTVTADESLAAVSAHEVISVFSADINGGIELGDGSLVKWDARFNQYRDITSGRFISRGRIGQALHRFILLVGSPDSRAKEPVTSDEARLEF